MRNKEGMKETKKAGEENNLANNCTVPDLESTIRETNFTPVDPKLCRKREKDIPKIRKTVQEQAQRWSTQQLRSVMRWSTPMLRKFY